MDDFLVQVAEVLEVPAVGLEDDFRAVPMWGSLLGFALMVLFEQRYGRRLTVEEFLRCRTVGDLAKAVGVQA